MTHLPIDIARCQPTGCRQVDRCARAQDWPTGDDIDLTVIDASVCLSTEARTWCPMFIDARMVVLLEAA